MPCLWYIFCLLDNTLVRTRTIPNSKDRELQCSSAPVTYSVQFQNGGFSQSDLIYISHSFVEFLKNCTGFPMKNTLCRTLDSLAC